jgi:hypothetical protein
MSKSDDDKNKENYKICIDDMFKNAKKHEDYCMKHCYTIDNIDFLEYPHTKHCVDLAKMHCNSFVECRSLYCLKWNDDRDLVPSYQKPKKKKKVINGLVYSTHQEE